jgi:hypothetical protein
MAGSKDHPNQVQVIKVLVLTRDPYRRYATALDGMPQRGGTPVSAPQLISV